MEAYQQPTTVTTSYEYTHYNEYLNVHSNNNIIIYEYNTRTHRNGSLFLLNSKKIIVRKSWECKMDHLEYI